MGSFFLKILNTFPMKNFILIICFGFLFHSFLIADTLTVKQNGSGNYSEIQDAVNHAANGDFILVYPGIYYENVDYKGKTLFISSLYCQNPSDSIINQTIIDGSYSGSCVHLISGEQNCFLTGFTLQHGSGTILSPGDTMFIFNWGGAIFLLQSSFTLEHCFIHDNVALAGGGIYCYRSSMNLIGNRIFNNHAYGWGGGILMGTEGGYTSNIYFDAVDLNSIYLNNASNGYDIYKVDGDLTLNTIHLDTGTVATQNKYYILSATSQEFPTDNITAIIDHAKIQQVDGDLFVNPNGNDNNSGLTPDDPLKTVAFALLKIKSSSTHQNTIWLSQGVYSETVTDEKAGFGFKNNVAIIGAGMDKTFIDLENHSYGGKGTLNDSIFIMKNLTVENGSGFINSIWYTAGFNIYYHHLVNFDSVRFRNMSSPYVSCLRFALNDSTIITNSVFENNKAEFALDGVNHRAKDSIFFKIQNCRFSASAPNIHFDNGLSIGLLGDEDLPDGKGFINSYIINCLVDNGKDSSIATNPSTAGLDLASNTKATIINCTLADNISTNQKGGAIGIVHGSAVKIYNSILYNNRPNQVYLTITAPEWSDTLIMYNSCMEDGINGIANYGDYNYLYYDSTNISDDPMFLGNDEYYYNLNDNSHCIDAGTLNFPDTNEIPATDLAGNPRIVGGNIDMGAYEWNPLVGTGNNRYKIDRTKHQIKVAPNPFITETHIIINTKKKASINIYNEAGLLVKKFGNTTSVRFSANILWDGTDNNGIALPAGIYFIVMSKSNATIESVKIIKQ